MFVLLLNDMRTAKIEDLQLIARAETKEALLQFIGNEIVDTYHDTGKNTFRKDHKFAKGFRKGGLLEWFNRPYNDKNFIDLAGFEIPDKIMALPVV